MRVTATRSPGSGTFVPLVVCTLLGLATETYFFSLFGISAFTRPYFWPGFLLSAFWVYCVITREFKPWHLPVWRFASIWSGIWTIWGILILFVPVFLFAFPAEPWLEETGVNPFLALFLHAVIWNCCRDILRSIQSQV